MALLATSITMRNKPSRLLDKGPDYLRTRTNNEIFANRRKSAVELLAASRPQYVKSAAVLDSSSAAVSALTAGTPDRHYRSFCQPREKPPVRSKSEFDVSKLQELLAFEDGLHDDVDGDDLPGEATARRLSEDLQPFSARGREEEERDAEGEEESRCTTTTNTTPHRQYASPLGDGESGAEGKIDSAADRQDESQRFFPSTADVAASAPPPPPSSSRPPVPPKPPFLASLYGSRSTQSAAPAIYTARPIYISLSRPTPPSSSQTVAAVPRSGSNGNSAAGAGSGDVTPVNRSIRVITASDRLVSPGAAMSEESLDKTPTNPTGGDMTGEGALPHPASAPVQGDSDPSWVSRDRGDGVTFAAVTSTTEAAAAAHNTSSTSSSPGPRLSLRSSGEFVAVGGMSGFNFVPRSFSDISCRHSQAGSDVSSEASRASRASAGASLERFFNEMGMDRDILDPMIHLQQRRFAAGRGHGGGGGGGGGGGSELDIYNSVSSLESHGDARSICSALSRSEKEISDPESFERSQQQTSVVERNARIIKWLCSVRKAKTPATASTSVQGSAAS